MLKPHRLLAAHADHCRPGLSRRRSRVRVPSLPSQTAWKRAVSCIGDNLGEQQATTFGGALSCRLLVEGVGRWPVEEVTAGAVGSTQVSHVLCVMGASPSLLLHADSPVMG